MASSDLLHQRGGDQRGDHTQKFDQFLIRLSPQVSPIAWKLVNGVNEYEPSSMMGVVESPRGEEGGACFAPLALNVTAVNLEAYYNKAINYTLMVTFVSFLQVLLLIRQMEYTNTQSVSTC